MSRKAIAVLNAINYEGLCNNEWGVIEDKSNSYFIKVKYGERKEFKGVWLYVWLSRESCVEFVEKAAEPDYQLTVEEEDEVILLYKV